MAETIHRLVDEDEVLEIPCITPGCEYHVTYDPKEPPGDATTEYSFGSKIVIVYLDCDKPTEPHRNKYKIKI
jgi:hypothetical protein